MKIFKKKSKTNVSPQILKSTPVCARKQFYRDLSLTKMNNLSFPLDIHINMQITSERHLETK